MVRHCGYDWRDPDRCYVEQFFLGLLGYLHLLLHERSVLVPPSPLLFSISFLVLVSR